MALTNLPTPEQLAKLVSRVTNTMLGISFLPDKPRERPAMEWRTALLPIPGARPVTIGLSSDQEGCIALSGAMFGVKREQVDSKMIDESLCELLNMTAGLVKGALSLDQKLGLPHIVASSPPTALAVTLRAEKLGLVLWIHEGI